MADSARTIVAESMKHRIANPGQSALASIDFAMMGRQVHADDFGRDVIPPASFAILIALAFDADRAREWEGMHLADR